ncbi:serine/threonine-protein kinase [Actinoplanes sp. GCM10030250]|uniref:serine/threonine-protein kinase n=1 Tax=Actinoplanes sp. GCM10030250 TaxID=3273376 RepID=UPI00361F47C9
MALSPLHPGDPRRIGTYHLLGRLGEGGMGSVFLGQSATGRRVAVKVVRPELSSDPEFRARFRSEVLRARQVPPFCTAEVLDADADHETPYLVVELVEGPSLAEVVQERGPLAGGSLHSVAIGVATALVAIHDAGVVHRDLKPANVLFALTAPKVIDFGIAKGLGSTDEHTEPGQVLGTIAYMGPERFDTVTSRSVGPATDVFAWGAVITYAATGHTPYGAEEMIAAAAGVPLPEPDLVGLPQPLLDLVGMALRADPDGRPTAHELLERLLRAGAAGDLEIRAGLARRPELSRAAAAVRHTVRMVIPRRAVDRGPEKWVADRRVGTGVLAAVVALTCGAGLAAVLRSGRPSGPVPAPLRSSIALDGRISGPASRDEQRPRCSVGGRVELSVEVSAKPACPPARTPGGWSVVADFALGERDACAVVRVLAKSGAYRVTACDGRIVLEAETGRLVRMLAFQSLRPSGDVAAWRHVEIRAGGSDLEVILGDRKVLNAPVETSPTRGAVVLGMTAGAAAGGGRAVVTFSGVVIEPI